MNCISLKVSSTTSQRFWQERWMIPCNKPLKASLQSTYPWTADIAQMLHMCYMFRPMNSFQKIFKAINFSRVQAFMLTRYRISFLKNQCIHFTTHKILQSMKRKWYPLVMPEFKCTLLSALHRGEANKG